MAKHFEHVLLWFLSWYNYTYNFCHTKMYLNGRNPAVTSQLLTNQVTDSPDPIFQWPCPCNFESWEKVSSTRLSSISLSKVEKWCIDSSTPIRHNHNWSNCIKKGIHTSFSATVMIPDSQVSPWPRLSVPWLWWHLAVCSITAMNLNSVSIHEF